MPLLFSLGIQNALEEVRQSLEEGEWLFAFLDDVYVLCSLERTRIIHDLLAETLGERAGIRMHTGETRTWNFADERPADLADLGRDVWNPLGIKILGTPVGMTNSWRISSRNGWQRSRNCGTPSHSSRTCNVHGKCFSSAPGHDATTCCAQFHHDSAQDMRTDIIWECSKRWKRCWGGSLEA